MSLKQKRIVIPNPLDDALGASIAALLDVLEQWEQLSDDEEIVIDMSRVTFVHPFFILPICTLLSERKPGIAGITYEIPVKLSSYLKTVHFPDGFSSNETDGWEEQISNYANKTYLPACKFPVSVKATSQRENFLAAFEQIMLKQLKLKGQIVTVIKYLISEAIDNITDHSGAANGWIMAQNYPQKGYLDVCIADAGRGIAGSYNETGTLSPGSDARALEYAVNGKSTKKITETRGYGIDTSRRMLVDGLNGKYFLISGCAFYIYTGEQEQIVSLQEYGWHGTMMALQIPSVAPLGFNYTNFLE